MPKITIDEVIEWALERKRQEPTLSTHALHSEIYFEFEPKGVSRVARDRAWNAALLRYVDECLEGS